ncbi:MAG: hypothetical protein R3B46_12810 [Phycisphaerales bacterium]
MSDDGAALLVDLHISGEIDDASMDLIPGSAGIINEITPSINDLPIIPYGTAAAVTIAVDSSKSRGHLHSMSPTTILAHSAQRFLVSRFNPE